MHVISFHATVLENVICTCFETCWCTCGQYCILQCMRN